MKSNKHFLLIPVYVGTVIFILIINGVFTGEVTSIANLIINLGFLAVMGILLGISLVSFVRLSHCTEELLYQTKQLHKEHKDLDEKELCLDYLKRQDVFKNEELNDAFIKYQLCMKKFYTKRGFKNICDIEDYINEDLIDRIGKNFYNSNIPGTLTGLGILGTFLGLSMGLATFNGRDILAVSDSMGPLLEGMKVAFHTSIYGIFLSIVFSFIYKRVMADAYDAMEQFQKAFCQYAVPACGTEDEDASAMIIYQANIAGVLKEILETLKQEGREQTKAVERIVERFMDRMTETMGEDFRKLGSNLKTTTDVQNGLTQSNKELLKTVEILVLANHDLQEKMSEIIEKQARISRELVTQKEEVKTLCDEISSEVRGQLYAFDKMRNLYEK